MVHFSNVNLLKIRCYNL